MTDVEIDGEFPAQMHAAMINMWGDMGIRLEMRVDGTGEWLPISAKKFGIKWTFGSSKTLVRIKRNA